ncbi:MAG: PAS domain S-box protein [Microcoleaceae cyanobacterium MO_207.B10]|nr:PAS domain S-box protein [Microcoleaceae cyanobacterium MO_207.B10]
MKKAPISLNEATKFNLLQQYQILDTPAEPEFDDITSLAAQICGTPVALISIVDETRHWFKSKHGWSSTEVSREIAFCSHAIEQYDIFIVPDALLDPRFALNPLVKSFPCIRFYAGVPLTTSDDQIIGTLCVIDHVARNLTVAQQEALKALSRQVMAQLELRRLSTQKKQLPEVLELERFFHISIDLLCVAGFDGYFKGVNAAFEQTLGYSNEQLLTQPFIEFVHPDDQDATLAEVKKLRAGNPTIYFENRYRDRDGNYKWLSWTAQPVVESELIYAIGRDMTQQKRAESERLELLAEEKVARSTAEAAQNQIERILESITDAFFSLDDQWQFTQLNQQAERLLRRTAKELLNKNIWEEFSEAVGTEFYHKYHKAVTEKVNVQFEAFYPPLDSWFLVYAYPCEKGLYVYFQDISDRKHAEEALRISESGYRMLFESNPHPMWVYDLKTLSFLAVNEAAIKHYGYSREEFLSMTLRDIRPPEDIPILLEKIANTTSGLDKPGIFRHQKKDGTIIYVEITSHGLTFAGKQAEIVLANDVTERMQAEAALLEMTTLQRAILDAANYTIISTSIDGTIYSFNAAAERLLGYSAEEVVGKTTPVLIHDLNEIYQRAEELTAELGVEITPGFEVFIAKVSRGQTDENEWTYIRKDGSRFPVLLSITALRNNEGNITGFLGIGSDITDRKQAEQKIREQAALLDVATDAILVRNLDKQILFWNQGAERLYGHKAEAALGQNANVLLYSEPLPQLEKIHSIVLKNGYWYGELNQVTKYDREILVESRWTLVTDNNEQPKFILVVNTDITEKKLLEQQFYRAQRLESIGTLASGIAHDLNNLLTPMLAVSQLLPMKFPEIDQRAQNLLKILEKNSRRGADLVKQVLSFATGVECQRSIVQLRHIILEVKQIINETFPKSIDIYIDISKDLYPVYGDATQLHQILINLCVNARDAMDNGGKLMIFARNVSIDENYTRINIDAGVGEYILLSIDDTGMGMSPEIQQRIFEPFFTTKGIGKGTGLGLSTALGIVKSHGGFVDVISKKDQGTKFKIYLPALTDSMTLPITDQIIQPGKGELILVVDDEVSICEVIKTSLEAYNYQVATASNGLEAIALYTQYKDEIEAVLIDMMMPGLNGVVTMNSLQEINPQVKIITTSGLSNSELVNLAKDAGVNEFLSKPFSSDELLLALHRVLN